jgi:hypothetical protein
MGVLDVRGEHATQFLDVLCTNYVPWIKNGESQYSYMLDPAGGAIDDVMLYKVSDERYIIVVNAVNSGKDLAWMNAVNSRSIVIDRQNPSKETLAEVKIRDLKDTAESGSDSLINIALQGPASLHILGEVARGDKERAALSRLEKKKYLIMKLGEHEVIGSVTSCAVDAEGFQVGMAYLDKRFTREGTRIALIPAPSGEREQRTPLVELRIGDRFPLQIEATVLSRFPMKES